MEKNVDYINSLKKRVDELIDVIKKQGKVLDDVKGIYSPYLDAEIEDMKHLRDKVLEK